MQQTENIELRWMQNLALDCGLTAVQAEKMLARLAEDISFNYCRCTERHYLLKWVSASVKGIVNL